MKMRDRIRRAGPLWNAMYERLDALIKAHNELVGIIFSGQNPHAVNDTTNVLSIGYAGNDVDSIIDLEQDLITTYEAHLADDTSHSAADSTNVVTEAGVPIEIYTLLNELKVDYEAHRVLTAGSVHAGADSTNTVTAANADTKAKAILLANDLRTQFIANYANVTSHHGAADTTNPPTSDALDTDATWTEIAAMADELRTSYEAHRQLTAGSVHGAADSTNTVTAAAIGTVSTALYAGLNELKSDFNAHIAESGTSHLHADISMKELNADASSTATALTLVNSLKDNYTDHITRADELASGPVVATLDEE